MDFKDVLLSIACCRSWNLLDALLFRDVVFELDLVEMGMVAVGGLACLMEEGKLVSHPSVDLQSLTYRPSFAFLDFDSIQWVGSDCLHVENHASFYLLLTVTSVILSAYSPSELCVALKAALAYRLHLCHPLKHLKLNF